MKALDEYILMLLFYILFYSVGLYFGQKTWRIKYLKSVVLRIRRKLDSVVIFSGFFFTVLS